MSVGVSASVRKGRSESVGVSASVRKGRSESVGVSASVRKGSRPKPPLALVFGLSSHSHSHSHFFFGGTTSSTFRQFNSTTVGASAFRSVGKVSSLVVGIFFTFFCPSRNSSGPARSS